MQPPVVSPYNLVAACHFHYKIDQLRTAPVLSPHCEEKEINGEIVLDDNSSILYQSTPSAPTSFEQNAIGGFWAWANYSGGSKSTVYSLPMFYGQATWPGSQSRVTLLNIRDDAEWSAAMARKRAIDWCCLFSFIALSTYIFSHYRAGNTRF